MKNILVLGHKGMLGHMVVEYLHTHNVIVHILDKPWPECKDKIKEFYSLSTLQMSDLLDFDATFEKEILEGLDNA